MLTADPFLTDADVEVAFPAAEFARDPTAAPRQLSPCLTDPRHWGAPQAEVETYRSRTDPTVTLNEFVLRFTDAAGAHRALLAVWAELNICRRPASASVPRPSANYGGWNSSVDEFFEDERADHDRHDGLYQLFVVRVGPVVIVTEDTAFPRDEQGPAHHFVERTMQRAIPADFVGPSTLI